MKKLSYRAFSYLGFLVFTVLVFLGSIRAFSRGGNDFSVFYEAWKLVSLGRGAEIYRVSPDRFLYCPAFAWLFSPLAWFSKSTALIIWSGSKIAMMYWLVRKLSQTVFQTSRLSVVGYCAWGAILLSKPILIDLEYGQVNLFILGACTWALLGHLDGKASPVLDSLRWFALSFAGVAKLFPLPLLFIPWVVTRSIPAKKLRSERIAVVCGVIILLLIPTLSLGLNDVWKVYLDWRQALIDRGLPLYSHNQSFTALLYHYLSGHPTPVIAVGADPMFGHDWLSQTQITLLSLFWSFSGMGLLLGWIMSGNSHPPQKWVSIVIGLTIVPSHLIWKPYFVMSLPLVVQILKQALIRKSMVLYGFLVALFAAINLTGFDFLGLSWGTHIEAASVLLLAHLFMLGWVVAAVPSEEEEIEAGFLRRSLQLFP